MFSYYGTKTKIVHLYPPPKYQTIIEPFAGAAVYSLRYPDNNVILVEIDEILYEIWSWLINEATIQDIENLPDLNWKDDIRTFKWLSNVERNLLGFLVGMGRERPGNIVTARAVKNKAYAKGDSRWRPNSAMDLFKKRCREKLSRIKHWEIYHGTYNEPSWSLLNAKPCTWFIDPPYIKHGNRYRYHDVDYNYLANWCKTRLGQVIVCEGEDADWLPFTNLKTNHRGNHRKLTEKIWTND